MSPSPTPVPAHAATHADPRVDTALPGLQDANSPEISSEEEEGEGEEMEIDEISDGEDDRRAHELLQAAPVEARLMGGSSPISLPYDNHNFAVCFIVYKYAAITDPHATQELGADQSVLQQHYARNRTPKAPVPQPV